MIFKVEQTITVTMNIEAYDKADAIKTFGQEMTYSNEEIDLLYENDYCTEIDTGDISCKNVEEEKKLQREDEDFQDYKDNMYRGN